MKYKIAVILTPNQTIKLQSCMSLMSSSQPVKQTLLKKKPRQSVQIVSKAVRNFHSAIQGLYETIKML